MRFILLNTILIHLNIFVVICISKEYFYMLYVFILYPYNERDIKFK